MLTGQPVSLESVFYELQALRKIYELLDVDFRTFKSSVDERMDAFDSRQYEHDKILIRGNGEVSLQERFRTLDKKLDDFISEQRAERERREKREAEEREAANKVKLIILGTLIPAALLFLYQFGVFWITIVPTLKP